MNSDCHEKDPREVKLQLRHAPACLENVMTFPCRSLVLRPYTGAYFLRLIVDTGPNARPTIETFPVHEKRRNLDPRSRLFIWPHCTPLAKGELRPPTARAVVRALFNQHRQSQRQQRARWSCRWRRHLRRRVHLRRPRRHPTELRRNLQRS